MHSYMRKKGSHLINMRKKGAHHLKITSDNPDVSVLLLIAIRTTLKIVPEYFCKCSFAAYFSDS